MVPTIHLVLNSASNAKRVTPFYRGRSEMKLAVDEAPGHRDHQMESLNGLIGPFKPERERETRGFSASGDVRGSITRAGPGTPLENYAGIELHAKFADGSLAGRIRIKNAPDRLPDLPDSYVVPPPLPAGTR